MTLRTLLAASLSLLLAVPALAAPTKLAQQGRVLDSTGEPLEGSQGLTFSLFDAATDGASLWSEERVATFEAGYYSITLGEQVPLDDLVFAGESVWLEISIGGEALTPRQEVVSVPYALRATAAEHVEGGMVDAEEISVDGTVVIDASGNWVGPTPAVGWGDLSGVPADIADGDQDTDTLAGLACAEGQLPKWDATASLWVCGDDIDTTDPNTDTLQSLACATGQIAKWDGTAWSCGEDVDTTDPNTDVLAGLACAEGQLPKWDATASLWICGDDIDTLDPNTDILAALPCADGFIAKMDGTTGLWACAPDADSFAELAGVCLPGDIPVLDPVSGSWTCGLDNDTVTTSLPWSSITGIPADIADGDQDTVTLTLPWSSITGIPADIADGDQDTDTLAGLACDEGQLPKWDAANSLWICGDDIDTSVPNTDTLLTLVCSAGQVAKWDGMSWTCAVDQDTVTQSLPWSAITGIPADIADGDQDTVDPNTDALADLSCTDGQIPVYEAATTSWVCIDLLSLLDQDGDGALAWSDCDDSNASQPNNDADCDGVLTADDCDDTDPASTVVATDGDCDGVLTADDCDDTDPTSTVVTTDADCDGVITASDCDDSDPVIFGLDGLSAACPGLSCKTILDDGFSVGSGTYWLNPTGSDLFQAYCDMTDGGWALAYNMCQDNTGSGMANDLQFATPVLPTGASVSSLGQVRAASLSPSLVRFGSDFTPGGYLFQWSTVTANSNPIEQLLNGTPSNAIRAPSFDDLGPALAGSTGVTCSSMKMQHNNNYPGQSQDNWDIPSLGCNSTNSDIWAGTMVWGSIDSQYSCAGVHHSLNGRSCNSPQQTSSGCINIYLQ